MSLIGFAAHQPGIVPDFGYVSRPGITNKCGNHNANPIGTLANMAKDGDAAASLREVDDLAALQAAGLLGPGLPCTNGKAYLLDNSAGTGPATAFATGACGNTNPHTVSAFVRGGSGSLSQSTSGVGGTIVSFAGSSSYVRVAGSFTPADIGRLFVIVADPGQMVFFILNQLAEGTDAGPVIVVAGAAASVGSDSFAVSMPLAATEDFVAWAVVNFTEAAANPTEAQRPLVLTDGTQGNRIIFSRTTGGVLEVTLNSAGVFIALNDAGDARHQPAAGRAVILVRFRGQKATTGAKNGSGAVSIGIESTSAITVPASTIARVGSDSGFSWARSPIEFVGVRKGSFSDAEIVAILQAA